MNSNIKKNSEWRDAFLIIILILISSWYMMPIIQSYFRSIGFIILISSFILLTIFYNKKITFIYFMLTIILILFGIIYISFGQNQKVLHAIMGLLYFFFPIYPSVYLFETKKQKTINVIVKTSLIMMLLTMLTTNVGLIYYPNASRILATTGIEGYNVDIYKKINIGGYGFIYMIIFSVYIFMYLYRKHKINISILIIALTSIITTVYRAQYTMALLILAIIIITSIFFKKAKVYQIITLIILGIILLFLGRNFLGEIFQKLSSIISNDSVSIRISEISQFFLYGNIDVSSDLGLRLGLYKNSLDSFLHSPLLGNSIYRGSETYYLGFHSEILDLIGGVGIIGAIPAISLILFYKRIIITKFKINKEYIDWYWYITCLFILSIFNTLLPSFEMGFIIFLLIPLATIYKQDSQINHLHLVPCDK